MKKRKQSITFFTNLGRPPSIPIFPLSLPNVIIRCPIILKRRNITTQVALILFILKLQMVISEDLCVFRSLNNKHALFSDHEALVVQFEVSVLKPEDKNTYQISDQNSKSCETTEDVGTRFLILSEVSIKQFFNVLYIQIDACLDLRLVMI